MSHHQPFTIGSQAFDLAHLDPVRFATPSDRLGRLIETHCWFTTHTFTEAAPDGHPGPVRLDEGNRPRVFCPDRYALSHHLPGTMRLLADPNCYVWEGEHRRNWLHRADVVIPSARVGGDPVTYQVFFAVKKAERNVRWDVEMVVESAYAFDPRRPPKTQGRTKISGLLAATVERRHLHTQRRR